MAVPEVAPELAWVRDRDTSRRWADYYLRTNDNLGVSFENYIVWTFGPFEDLYYRGRRAAWIVPVVFDDNLASAMHRVMWRVWWQVYNRVAIRLKEQS